MENLEQGYFKNPDEQKHLQNEIDKAVQKKIEDNERQLDLRIEALKTQLAELNDRILYAEMQENEEVYKSYVENFRRHIVDTKEQLRKIEVPIEMIKSSSLSPETDQNLRMLEDRRLMLENKLQDLLVDIERAYEVPDKEEFKKWKEKADILRKELEQMYTVGGEEDSTGFSLN